MDFGVEYVVIAIFAWLFSTTIHEASHAFVAFRSGDPTAYNAGQVTLNPIPHIKREPMGMLIVPLAMLMFTKGMMIGWASAPYDPHWAARHPHRAAKMAMAGPASNLCLLILCLGLLKLGLQFGWFANTMDGQLTVSAIILQFLNFMVGLNLLLLLFNLIPLPPLDGSEGILLFFPEHRASEIRTKMRSVGIFGILIAIVVLQNIYYPVYSAMMSLVF